MKKTIGVIIIIIFLFAATLSLGGCNERGDIWLKSMDIDATLLENGDLKVTEKWVAKLLGGESYQNIYKVFNLYDRDFGVVSQLKDISVYDNDNNIYYTQKNLSGLEYGIPKGAENSWYLDDKGSSNYEFGWVMPPVSSGTRSFTFSYTITDMASRFNDTALLYWQILNTDFTLYIEQFNASISLPNNQELGESMGWFHIETPESNLTLENKKFVYTASDIEAGTMVESRILIPNEKFGELRKSKNINVVEDIRQEELEWAEEWQKELNKQRTLAITDVVLAALALLAAISYAIIIRIINRRIKGDYPEYVREIPRGWTVSELGHLFYHYEGGVVKNRQRGKLLSATLLDLARRRYIEILPLPSGDYRIKVINVSEAQLLDLKPHERAFYDLLKDVQEFYKQEFSMDEFEKYAKKEYIRVDRGIRDFQNKSKSKFDGLRLVEPKLKGVNMLSFVCITLIFIGVVMVRATALPFVNLALSLIVSGIIMLIFTPRIPRLSKKGEELYQELQGLKKYMLDFSNLKEYDVPKLVLWEEYLVFATMMGISKEVIKSLKLVYPELQAMDNARAGYRPGIGYNYMWTYIWLSSVSRSGGFGGGGFDLGARFDTAFNNIATTAHSLVNPNKGKGGRGGFGGGGFGGGGFGGGGGGFGGGGGGAR